jgi:ankyrin repeat protein
MKKTVKHTFKVEDRYLFIEAAEKGNFKTVKKFIEDGMPVDTLSKNGTTALIQSIINNRHEMTDFLIETGANINIRTKGYYKTTALIWAARTENPELIIKLLELNAYPFLTDETGDTVAHWIIGRFKNDISHHQIPLLSLCLEKGLNINQQNFERETLLTNSLIYNNNENQVELTTFLLNKGAILNNFSKQGRQPIHLASLAERMDSFNLLIERGSDINSRDINGNTPVFVSNTEIGLLNIIAHGPDLSIMNYEGNTPLIHRMTLINDKVDVPNEIKIMIGAGANINQPNAQGQTPKEIAKIKRLTGMMSLIKSIENRQEILALIESKADNNKRIAKNIF